MKTPPVIIYLGMIVILLIAGCATNTAMPIKTLVPTPESSATPSVHVRYKGRILDKETQRPVTGTVKLDGVVVFRNVSSFETILPNDTREKPVYVQVEADGYQDWAQGYRYFWITSKVYDFPIELEREVKR